MVVKALTPEQIAALQDDSFVIDVPSTTPPAPPAQGRLFSEEDVEAIRKQEKDKLYQTIEKEKERVTLLSSQLDQFNQERVEAARLAAEAVQREEDTRKAREQDELSAKELIAVKESEWNQKLSAAEIGWNQKLEAIQAERDQAAALLLAEQNFQLMQSYKNHRLAESGDAIVPEFIQLLEETNGFGNTEEEIDRAISTLIAKSSSMIENIQQSAPAPRLRGVSPTGATPTGPLDNTMEQQVLTANDIKNMSIAEYAKVRDRLMAQAHPRRGR